MFFPPFLKHTFFSRFQLKSWLFWTEQERLIFPPTAPEHILSFCCTGQSRPAVAKLSFLCFFPFLLALRLLWCLSYIVNLNPVKSSPPLLAALPSTYFIPSSLHSSDLISSRLSSCPPLSAFPRENLRGLKAESGLSILPSVRGPVRSQTSHHRRAALTRGEEILT